MAIRGSYEAALRKGVTTALERADLTWQNFENFDISLHFPEGVT